MVASDKIEIQQEIRKLVAQRDIVNDRLRSYRLKHSRGLQQKQVRSDQNSNDKLNTERKKDSKDNSNDALNKGSNKRTFENSRNNNFFGPDFEVQKRPKVVQDDKTQDRNRRMMSIGILGHLFSARAQLQKEESSKNTQLQRDQAQKVEEKLEFGKRNLLELKKRDFEERRTEDLLQAEMIQSKLIEKENELTRINLVNHYQNMRNFIGTKCQPMIFWYPAKMNNTTESLKQETINSIEGKINSFKSKDFSGVVISRHVFKTKRNDDDFVTSSSEYITPAEPSSEFITPIENNAPAEASLESADYNERFSDQNQDLSDLKFNTKENPINSFVDPSTNKLNSQTDPIFTKSPATKITGVNYMNIGPQNNLDNSPQPKDKLSTSSSTAIKDSPDRHDNEVSTT